MERANRTVAAGPPRGYRGEVGNPNVGTELHTAESITKLFDLPRGVVHLTTGQLAQLLNMQEESVRRWRRKGKGPGYIRWGTSVRYPLADFPDGRPGVVTFLNTDQPSETRRGPRARPSTLVGLPAVPPPPPGFGA